MHHARRAMARRRKSGCPAHRRPADARPGGSRRWRQPGRPDRPHRGCASRMTRLPLRRSACCRWHRGSARLRPAEHRQTRPMRLRRVPHPRQSPPTRSYLECLRSARMIPAHSTAKGEVVMTSRMTAAVAALLLLTFLACKSETTDGLPNTETTGTSQSPSTATSDPTTTGATGGTSSPVTPTDKEWVTTAGMAGMAEVQMGNLAMQTAENAEVKSFAQRMVTDHSKSNEELQQLVTAKGLTLAAQLDGEHKSAMDHLTGLSGAEFDKAYMQHMVADHDKA